MVSSFLLFCILVAQFIHINAQMIVQSCVKDIFIRDLTAASYGSTINITLTVNNDNSNQKYTQTVPFISGSANLTEEICFDFDTSATTTTISYNPKRGRTIKFDILGNSVLFGGAYALFPNAVNGSIKSSFKRESVSIFDGTMTFSLYHQIKSNNLFLKIANRNFNVFRQCFDLKRLCIYEGGIENAQYPNDCSSKILSTHITLNPDDGTIANPKANILSNDDNLVWSSTPTPKETKPVGTNTQKCWSPYSQYIIVDLSAITSFSAISLGFTLEPSDQDSGDANGAPPRWLTFAFDSDLSHLQSSETDVDQYWTVDLKGGNFDSENDKIWTVNPLFFQLDTKPAPNRFRMTQLTKGFGLQYIQNANIEYQSTGTTTWSTYAAAYIKNGVVNTQSTSDPANQVNQLAQIACQDIFPNTPTVKKSYRSDEYSACWNYASNRNYKCYDYLSSPLTYFTSGSLSLPVWYPPVTYYIKSLSSSTATTLPYCNSNSADVSLFNDWNSCNIFDQAPTVIQECVNDPSNCDNGQSEFHAIPMGWECDVPVTNEPTKEPTMNPITAAPTTASPTSNPTLNPTTANPTVYPTNNPTFNPSVDPTVDPTSDPTADPTFDPTMDPTLDPTNDPTTEPTNVPSTNPTIEPTQYPTWSPSESTLAPSQTPTMRPTDNPIISNENVTPEPTPSPGAAGGKEGDNDNENTLPWWVGLVITCGVVLLCCCFMILFFGRSHDKKQKIAVEDHDDDKSLADIAAITDADSPKMTTRGTSGTTQAGTNTSIELAEATKANQSSSSESDDDEQDMYAKGSKKTKDIDDMYGNMPRQMTDNGGGGSPNGDHNRLSVAAQPNLEYQPSDDNVLNEGNITMGMPDSQSPNSPSSMEGGGQHDGDPAVTGANMGDPQITKGGNKDTKSGIILANGGASSSEDESDKVYDKDSDSESDNDNDGGMYDKKNKYVSKGGPVKVKKKKSSEKYGDPAVTLGGNDNDDEQSEDEFDDEENYKI